ncbi:hypothetical protein DUNSADRAFT_16479 [Dunaliella salina]|nr:hypothetical protein DUNSADRAFT_16479 [Dunaliella salina]|eukprot:KAF5829165.1 hypothetical protein DUNSADRAFT_16479 [Dunaliella salina]
MLHLSYHDGMHYNSVRNADDFGKGPPQPVLLKPVAETAGDTAPGAVADGHTSWGPREEARVLSSTACERPSLARAALAAMGGNVDLAIEYVIEQLAKEEEVGVTGHEEDGGAKAAPGQEHGEEESHCSNPTAVHVSVDCISPTEGTQGQQSGQEAEGGQASPPVAAAGAAVASTSQRCQHKSMNDCNCSSRDISCGSVHNGGALVPHEAEATSIASTVTDVKGASSANGDRVELLDGCDSAGGCQQSNKCQQLQQTKQQQQQQQQQVKQQQTQQQQRSLPESLQRQTQDKGEEFQNPAQPCCNGVAYTNSSVEGDEQQEPLPQQQQQQQQQQQSDGHPGSKKGVRVGKKDQRPDKQPSRNKPCPCGSKIKYKDCCLVRKKKAADMPQPEVAPVGGAPTAKQLATIFL